MSEILPSQRHRVPRLVIVSLFLYFIASPLTATTSTRIGGSVHEGTTVKRMPLSACPPPCKCDENITRVDCSGLKLTTYPKLPLTVRDLSLHDNLIKSLAKENLSQTPAIETLDLSKNKLTSFADEVFINTTHVLTLDLSENEITSLNSRDFYGLSRLQTLRLSSNHGLQNMNSSTFIYLESLYNLEVKNCSLRRLVNSTFLGLTNLHALDLSQNLLTYTESSFDPLSFLGLFSLVNLNIGQNNLFNVEATTPESAFKSRSTQSEQSYILKSRDNPGVVHLSNSPERRRRTTFYGDILQYPDRAISVLTNLTSLTMDGVPDVVLGDGFRNLTRLAYLYFSDQDEHCQIRNMTSGMFRALNRTTSPLHLRIKNCNVQNIATSVFEPIPNIQFLDLSWNYEVKFDQVSKGLASSNLTTLELVSIFGLSEVNYLSYKYIVHLKNTPLKDLDFSHNRIYKTDTAFMRCLPPTLERLDLSWNYLMDPTGFFFLFCLPSIKVLDISHQIHFHSHSGQRTFENVTDVLSDDFVCPSLMSLGSTVNVMSSSVKCHCPVKPHKNKASAARTVAQVLFLRKPISDHKIQNSNTTRQFFSHKSRSLSKANSKLSPHGMIYTRDGINSPFPYPFPKTLEEVYGSDMNLKYSIPGVRISAPNSLRHLEYAANGAFCWGGPLENFDHVEYLDLSENKCRIINLDFFQTLPNISTLLLNLNSLGPALHFDEEGKFFSPLAKLKRIELRSNLLTRLPRKMFSNNYQLERVDLSDNFLVDFQVDLSHLEQLQFLNLSYNKELMGFSSNTAEQFFKLKNHLKVDVRQIGLSCNCRFLSFLHLMCTSSSIFVDVYSLHCAMPASFGGIQKPFPKFCPDLKRLERDCFAQDVFTGTVIIFAVLASVLIVAGIVSRYRWKIRYLYYIGRQRLHLGNRHITYQPLADVFLTYDREDEVIRHFVQTTFLPRLQGQHLKVIIGERDFPGGHEVNHISGAIVGSRKVLVLLSRDIFEEVMRQFEINMTILYEMNMRTQQLLPVYLEENIDINVCYPPEVVSFLDGQHERCFHFADDAQFWSDILREIGPSQVPRE